MTLRLFLLAAALGPLALAPGRAAAQSQPAADADTQEHVLEIRDGRMFLDGRALPAGNLPEGLDLAGIPGYTINFVGPVVPVLEIDGVVYVLDGEHFKRLSETERADDRVFFIPSESALPAEPADAPLMEAGEEAYLRQLSTRDRSLYEQIEREQALEHETLRLAARIRAAQDAAERARLVQALRAQLDASFELKQAIRGGEIAQAEAQIEELRRLLHERAERKDQIIERRIQELVGSQR